MQRTGSSSKKNSITVDKAKANLYFPIIQNHQAWLVRSLNLSSGKNDSDCMFDQLERYELQAPGKYFKTKLSSRRNIANEHMGRISSYFFTPELTKTKVERISTPLRMCLTLYSQVSPTLQLSEEEFSIPKQFVAASLDLLFIVRLMQQLAEHSREKYQKEPGEIEVLLMETRHHLCNINKAVHLAIQKKNHARKFLKTNLETAMKARFDYLRAWGLPIEYALSSVRQFFNDFKEILGDTYEEMLLATSKYANHQPQITLTEKSDQETELKQQIAQQVQHFMETYIRHVEADAFSPETPIEKTPSSWLSWRPW